jgi:cell division septal protein FtsQ
MQLQGRDVAGLEVRLGRTDLAHRVDRFVRVFSMRSAPELAHSAYLDLRYPNGFAMRMKQDDVTDGEHADSETPGMKRKNRRVEEA